MMKYVEQRLSEFRELGERGEVVFDFRPFLDLRLKANVRTELAFCISTANSSATAGLKFQKLLAEGMEVHAALRQAGVRFHNRKAEYIRMALKNFHAVENALKLDSKRARQELLNLKGLGMKEASHFLRNVGREDVAIIDRHILRWLEGRGYEIPRTMTQKSYIEIERVLGEIADTWGKNLAELDLIIWAEMTGKVLK